MTPVAPWDTRFIVECNWKMHLLGGEAAGWVAEVREALPRFRDAVELVICCPFTLIHRVVEEARGSPLIAVGAQDVHWMGRGAYTGEISAPQLADAGVRYCVVGHSERRRDFGETDDMANRKARALLAAGISPILCIGEDRETRRAGRTREHVGLQLARCLDGVTPEELSRTVILYEPVWAVGSGENATAGEAGEAHALIRRLLRERYSREAADAARIIYGGSVTPESAPELLAIPDLDGLGMGKASLEVGRFIRLAELCRDRALARPLRPIRES